jgi:tetratricopeptide (TPR) repeat protein
MQKTNNNFFLKITTTAVLGICLISSTTCLANKNQEITPEIQELSDDITPSPQLVQEVIDEENVGMAIMVIREGDKFLSQKLYKEALIKYQYAETLTPDNPEIYYKKAAVLRKLDRIKDADEALRLAKEKENQ